MFGRFPSGKDVNIKLKDLILLESKYTNQHYQMCEGERGWQLFESTNFEETRVFQL